MTYERAKQLMEAELGDEIVALEPDAGLCFGFNPVAASVWRLLDQPRTVDQLQAALLDEYDVEPERCAADLQLLLADLTERKLIRIT